MPWRGRNAKWCHGCDRHVSECGKLSARYLCQACGNAAQVANTHGLRTMSGEPALRWRRGMAASVGAVLPEPNRAQA